jgi:nucleotide-binding universal stress UspA family protein
MPQSPLLFCYDGSEDAKNAIGVASDLFSTRAAIVMSVWQTAAALPAAGWAAVSGNVLEEVLTTVRAEAARVADEGVEVATAAGFNATPLVVEAPGPIWDTIVETADQRDTAAIVMGSRGLSGVRSLLLGSVSSGVTHHATRPTLVVRRTD